MNNICSGKVPTLEKLCQDALILALAKLEPQYHAKKINDLCKCLPGHLLEPILASLLEQNRITDVALSMFLVPERLHLSMNGIVQIKNSTFKQIGYSCPNLVSLNLSDCVQLSNSVVRAILQGCPSLAKMRLDRCRRITDAAFDINQSPFQSLLGCLSLKSLSMQGCPSLTGQIVDSLNKLCVRLKYLNLSQCNHIERPAVQQIFEHCSILSLNLSFVDEVTDAVFCEPPSVFTVAEEIHQMNQLMLYGTSLTTPQFMEDFVKRDVDNAEDVVVDSSILLPIRNDTTNDKNHPHHPRNNNNNNNHHHNALRNRDHEVTTGNSSPETTDDSDDNSLENSINLIHNDRHHRRSSEEKESDESSGDNESEGRELRRVESSTHHRQRQQPRQRKSPLRVLYLAKSGITDKCIPQMAFLSNLTELHLQWCSSITDAGIASLVLACPQLTCIDLKSCSITDQAVAAIAKGFRDLKSLNVSWCSSITDKGIQELAPAYRSSSASRRTSSIAAAFAELPDNNDNDVNDDEDEERDLREGSGDWDDNSGWEHLGARKLEHLNVVWCSQLTDAALTALVTLPCLKSIEASGCSGIDQTVVTRLRALGITVTI